MNLAADHPEALTFNKGLLTLFKQCWTAVPRTETGQLTKGIMLTTLVWATATAIAQLAEGDERTADAVSMKVEEQLRREVAEFIAHANATKKGIN